MLVEMAVADAYAIAWEFTDKQSREPDFTAFVPHPTYVELQPGQYTDDTQRAIANVDVMLSFDPHGIISPLFYAESYVHSYWRDPREGYSRGYQALLKSTTDGVGFLQKVQPTKTSNGSIMGVAPLGFIGNLPGLKLAATVQAITTHHPQTSPYAQIVALASHFFIHTGGSRNELLEFIMDNVDWASGTNDAMLWLGEMTAFGLDSKRPTSIKASNISAYVVSVLSNQSIDSLVDIIGDAVVRGGDTDSAAASGVAVASMCGEIKNDIPQHLIDAMDHANPNFGVEFLTNLENQLVEQYGAIQ